MGIFKLHHHLKKSTSSWDTNILVVGQTLLGLFRALRRVGYAGGITWEHALWPQVAADETNQFWFDEQPKILNL